MIYIKIVRHNKSWRFSALFTDFSAHSVAVAMEADSQGASKQSSLLLSPDLWPDKLGITKKNAR
jgi:hypothetical protein